MNTSNIVSMDIEATEEKKCQPTSCIVSGQALLNLKQLHVIGDVTETATVTITNDSRLIVSGTNTFKTARVTVDVLVKGLVSSPDQHRSVSTNVHVQKLESYFKAVAPKTPLKLTIQHGQGITITDANDESSMVYKEANFFDRTCVHVAPSTTVEIETSLVSSDLSNIMLTSMISMSRTTVSLGVDSLLEFKSKTEVGTLEIEKQLKLSESEKAKLLGQVKLVIATQSAKSIIPFLAASSRHVKVSIAATRFMFATPMTSGGNRGGGGCGNVTVELLDISKYGDTC